MQQVSESESGQERNPEGNLAAHNQRVQRAFTGTHRFFSYVSDLCIDTDT
jgi:hypothetical protein